MPRNRSGCIFKLKEWGNNVLEVYLPNMESKALKFVIERSKLKDASIHPYEIARILWPSKYPEFDVLTSDQMYKFEDGISDAMTIVSNIRSKFRSYIEEESLLGVYDPFPFFIMNDPRSDFRAIALSDGIEVVECINVKE